MTSPTSPQLCPVQLGPVSGASAQRGMGAPETTTTDK